MWSTYASLMVLEVKKWSTNSSRFYACSLRNYTASILVIIVTKTIYKATTDHNNQTIYIGDNNNANKLKNVITQTTIAPNNELSHITEDL